MCIGLLLQRYRVHIVPLDGEGNGTRCPFSWMPSRCQCKGWKKSRSTHTETCGFSPSAEPQPPSPRPCRASPPSCDALATPRARCHRRLGISKIRRPKGAPGSRGSRRPDGATSTAHPVRPRVSLLKELCTSPDCCAGCYAGILRRWQVTVRELARNRSIRAYILLLRVDFC